MWDALYYLAVVIAILIAVMGLAYLARTLVSGGSAAGLFGPRPERRLDVVEHANIDGRRRLILVRRDNVEHLIMTGGPVDLVVETGIQGQPPPPVQSAPQSAASSTVSAAARAPR